MPRSWSPDACSRSLTGKPYETALKELVLDPLGLKRSGFFTDELIGENISASHDVENDRAVVMTGAWVFPRSIDSTGGLISSASEQLAYARFHLGDGTGADGKAVLSQRSLEAMRANPGPGGTITMEIDGVCVGWWQRRTAEGVPVFQHGGSWGGQKSDFFFVPDRQFAMIVLTNATSGGRAPGRAGTLRLGVGPVLRVEQSTGRSQAAAGGRLARTKATTRR